MREEMVFKSIEEEIRLQSELSAQESPGELDSKWSFLASHEPKRIINEDLTIKKDVLRNFRKLTIFIPDEPSYNPTYLNPKNIFIGRRKGIKRLIRDTYSILKENNYLDILNSNPLSMVGNPYYFQLNKTRLNLRWAKHVSYMGILKRYPVSGLSKEFTHLDIGSSYGIFSFFLKREFPSCHSILLDFPGQLILARYFLSLNFPQAKIAGVKEILEAGSIDRKFINQYDFILLPHLLYKKIQPLSLDLVTNFASLGEMSRKWFNHYLESEPFLSAKYFLTVNRFQSYPTYDNDLTILDYPLAKFKKLHFGAWPLPQYTYKTEWVFFYDTVVFNSQYFEFFGERILKGV